jgi:hypothetical protein
LDFAMVAQPVVSSPDLGSESGDARRTEIVVDVEDRPGALATVGELLGRARVNIVAAAVFAAGDRGVIHLVVDDSDAALAALKLSGVQVSAKRDVYVVTLEDRPGELGRFARKLADSGHNISALYLAGHSGGDKELIVALESDGRQRGIL